MKVLFASKNKGKIKEVKDILAKHNFEVISLFDLPESHDVVEDGLTFLDNAQKKAREMFELFQIPTIADDSGLMVDQLNGEPGVYSARYAGENCTYDDNNKKLLNALINYPAPHKARFISMAVFYDGSNYIPAEGILEGEIISEPKGNEGFGYDPVFVPQDFNRTLAELSLEEKNKISHRAKAFNILKDMLKDKGYYE